LQAKGRPTIELIRSRQQHLPPHPRGYFNATTFSACNPLVPAVTANSTRWPSRSDLPFTMERKCTKISSPLSRVMKPKPLFELNHFTFPSSFPLWFLLLAGTAEADACLWLTD